MSKKVSRKKFIKRSAVGLTAATLAGAAFYKMSNDANLAMEYPEVPENNVRLPKHGHSVLIIGAGLSGLVSACELIDRGFDVTILEKNDTAGGRLRSWRDFTFGGSKPHAPWPGHPIEHGTHIILGFYNNFREMLRRRGLKIRDKICNSPKSAIATAFPDGIIDDRPNSTAMAPFHAAGLLNHLPHAKTDDEKYLKFKQLCKVLSFDPTNLAELDYLDNISLKDWLLNAGFDPVVIRDFFDPLMDMANFHPSDKSSALYFHRFAASMTGNWRDLFQVQFFNDSTDDSIIQPLLQYVRRHGGKVYFNSEVDAFESDGDQITSVSTKKISGSQYICPICGEIHDTLPDKCRRCGYRGNQFKKIVSESQQFKADYFLLGVDIPAAKSLFKMSPFNKYPFFEPVQNLPTSSVVVVYLWYPRAASKAGKKNNWADHFADRECLLTGDFSWLGTTLNLSYLKPDAYGSVGADIIETQICRIERIKGLSEKQICDNVHSDLKKLIPGLPMYSDFRMMHWDNFSTMTVGAEKNRPDMFTPLKNFLILGDFNKLDHNCILMEKITVNTKKAVNHLLRECGVQGGQMTILPSGTPHIGVKLFTKVSSVIK